MECRLTASVAGDPAPLHALIERVAGPGCVIWPDVDPRAAVETTIGLLLRGGAKGGATSYDEARRVAVMLANKTAARIADGQRRCELEPFGCPLDLQAIKPIPREILLSGYSGGGKRWLIENWGVDKPLSRVDLKIQTRIEAEPRGRGRPRAGVGQRRAWTSTTAVWAFVSETFPWVCFRRLLRDWPGIAFRVEFDEAYFGRFDRTWPALETTKLQVAA